jgi:hypothetical protein
MLKNRAPVSDPGIGQRESLSLVASDLRFLVLELDPTICQKPSVAAGSQEQEAYPDVILFVCRRILCRSPWIPCGRGIL